MKGILQFYVFLKMLFGMRVRSSLLVKAYDHKAVPIVKKYRQIHFDITSADLDYIMMESRQVISDEHITSLVAELIALHIVFGNRPERRILTGAKIGAIILRLSDYRAECKEGTLQHSALSLFCLYDAALTNVDKMRMMALYRKSILQKL